MVDGSLPMVALIELFRYLLRFWSYEAKCLQLGCFRSGRPLCAQILPEHELSPSTTLGVRKLETLSYLLLKTASLLVPSFRHNTFSPCNTSPARQSVILHQRTYSRDAGHMLYSRVDTPCTSLHLPACKQDRHFLLPCQYHRNNKFTGSKPYPWLTHRGRHAKNFWVDQICSIRPTFYKRSMAYKPQHWDWGVGQTELIV